MKIFRFMVFLALLTNAQIQADEVSSVAAESGNQCDLSRQLSLEERMSILKLQTFQMEYDEDYWFNRDFEKFRHILLHLVDDVGKLAKYCETKEHDVEPDCSQLIHEVLPDLLMHTLQFANAFDVDLGEQYEARINANIRRMNAAQNAKTCLVPTSFP